MREPTVECPGRFPPTPYSEAHSAALQIIARGEAESIEPDDEDFCRRYAALLLQERGT